MKNQLHKILTWYFSKKSLPYWCILLMDSVIIFASGFFSYWLFYRGYQTLMHSYRLAYFMLFYVVLSWIGMRLFHTYAGIIRYASFVDLRRVFNANFITLVIAIAAHYIINKFTDFAPDPMDVRMLTVTILVATAVMCGVRVLIKSLYEVMVSDKKALRCLIYGTMTDGTALAKSIRIQEPVKFVLKGFITHDSHDRHDQLMGQHIYSTDDDIAEVIAKDHIEAVLVSPQHLNEFRNDQALQDVIIEAGLKIYISQDTHEMSEEDDNKDYQFQELSVEDLLPRDEIVVDMYSVGKKLKDKKVLITGSAGSIGSEIVRLVAGFGPQELLLIDQAETPQHDIRLMMKQRFPKVKASTIVTSICDEKRMEQLFADFKPDYVFHAAAYKHVPMMEDNPGEAVRNNIYGTKVIADLSDKYKVEKFVMISTDKAVNPTNVMGCSKRICEIYVQSLGKQSKTQFVTTRFGNVLGSNGSVIPLFKEQIKNGGPVTVTHPEITRYFMLIPEACKLVLEAGTRGKGGEIFVFDMGKPVRIAELAERMIKMSNAKNVKIEFTGLRPGEKLYEEVLNVEENTKPTFHKKIRIAEVREYDYNEVKKDIDDLIAISQQYDEMSIVRKMKAIVPEFKSNNSIYEKLDK